MSSYEHDTIDNINDEFEINIWNDPDFDLIDDPPVKNITHHWWVVKLPSSNKKRFNPIYYSNLK